MDLIVIYRLFVLFVVFNSLFGVFFLFSKYTIMELSVKKDEKLIPKYKRAT